MNFKRMRAVRNLGTAIFLSAALAGTGAVWGEDGEPAEKASVIVVVGAPGEETYGGQFAQWAEQWREHAAAGGHELRLIGLAEETAGSDKETLRAALAAEPKEGPAPLWIVLLGHGTFDGKVAKFNLRGPDLSASECAEWLQPFQRPVAFVDCSSSSGAFMNALSATNRVIITATRSGFEQNYARFGKYLSQIIADPEADLDKDGQTSLLEAYLMASRMVDEFYESEGRLATEHALLDDTGDEQGTPADWFRGVRVVKKAKEGVPDGFRAHQFHLVPSELERALPTEIREKRDHLELSIFQWRERKGEMEESDYYAQLEMLFLELARLYEQVEPEKQTEPTGFE